MSYRLIQSCLPLCGLLCGPAVAQGTSEATLQFTAEDFAYTSEPGFHYEIVPLTVTDGLAFSFDATSLTEIGTGIPQTTSVLVYVFDIDTELPAAPETQLTHLTDPDLVFSLADGSPNSEAPLSPDGITLEEGQYQMVIAPFDPTGAFGDQELSFSIEGGVLLLIPLPATELAQVTLAGGSAGRLVVGEASSLAARQARASFFARRPASGAEATVSSRGAPGLVGNLYAWIEVTGFRSDGSTTIPDLQGRGLQIGADVAVVPGVLTGLSFGYTDVSASGAGFTQDGTLLYVQPYLAYESGPLILEGSIMAGWGDLTQTSVGGTGGADMSLLALTGSGRYEYAGWGNTVVAPTVSMTLGQQEIMGISGTLAGTGRSVIDFSEVSIGTDLAFTELSWGEPRIGLHLDWSSSDAGGVAVADPLVNDSGWSGRVTMGLTSPARSGLGVEAALELGGIGADRQVTRGALRLDFRF